MKHSQSASGLVPLSISVIWLSTPFIALEELSAKASAGAYGTNDSILIPFAGLATFCVIGIPYFAFFAIAGFRRYVDPPPQWQFQSTPRQWLVLALFLLGLYVLIPKVLSWTLSGHGVTGLMHGLAVAWLVWVRPIAAAQLPVRIEWDISPFKSVALLDRRHGLCCDNSPR
jgi:hypothetical protein